MKLSSKKVVIDASVLVKTAAKEQYTENAITLLSYCKNRDLHLYLPELSFYELSNVLIVNNYLEEKDISLFILSLQKACQKILFFSGIFITNTIKIAYNNTITAYDAAYISAAEQEGAMLITDDRKHHQKNMSKSIVYLHELTL